jgi:hypothetical protein
MTKQDLFRTAVGSYELTDKGGIYKYTLHVCLTQDDDRERCYSIHLTRDKHGSKIFILEEYLYEHEDDDVKTKVLNAMSGVGCLSVQSNDTAILLSELIFIQRGSFAKFVEKTKQS